MSKQNPFGNNYKHYYGNRLCSDDHPSKPCGEKPNACSCCTKYIPGPVGPAVRSDLRD